MTTKAIGGEHSDAQESSPADEAEDGRRGWQGLDIGLLCVVAAALVGAAWRGPIGLAAFGTIGAALFCGLALWWPPGGEPNRRSEMGAGLVCGAVVGTALLLLQIAMERRQEQLVDRIELSTGSLVGADLGGDDLSGMEFGGRDLTFADLTDANLGGTNLALATLRGADLANANLRDADLRGADLSDANLTGADLDGARLADATLDSICYGTSTAWPAAFVPPASSC